MLKGCWWRQVWIKPFQNGSPKVMFHCHINPVVSWQWGSGRRVRHPLFEYWVFSEKSSCVLPDWQGFLPCVVLWIFSEDNWMPMAWFVHCTNICGLAEHKQTGCWHLKKQPLDYWAAASDCTQLLLHWSWDIKWFGPAAGAHQTNVCAHLQQREAVPMLCTAHHLCSWCYAETWLWRFVCGRHKSSEISLDHEAQQATVSDCHLFSHFLMHHNMGTGLVMLEDAYNTNMPLGTLDFAERAESQFVTLFPFAVFKMSWVDCK